MTREAGEPEPAALVECPTVRFTSDSAVRLADLVATYRDLQFVSGCCDLLLKLDGALPEGAGAGGDEAVTVEAVWTAALIAYARCFKTGKRFGLTEDFLDRFDGAPHEFHRMLINMRDKHIAHSVNPYETVVVGAVLSPEGSDRPEVLAVSHLWLRHIVADVEGVEALRNLAGAMAREIATMSEVATAAVLAEAQAVPIEELYRLERLRVTAPAPEDAGSARPR